MDSEQYPQDERQARQMNSFESHLPENAVGLNGAHEATDSSQESLESDLRALFAEQAAEPIATDAAWARIAPRLVQMGDANKEMITMPVSGPMPTQTGGIHTMMNTTSDKQRERQAPISVGVSNSTSGKRSVQADRRHWGWRRRALTAVAAVVVAAALMGAGYGAASYFGWLGNPKLEKIEAEHHYTTLNQTQTQQGVQVTLDWAYADPGDFYLSYHSMGVTVATRDYNNYFWMTYDLRDQFGEINQGGYTSCQEGPGNGGAQYCLMDMGALKLPGSVSTLNVTLEISTIMLAKGGSSHTVTLHGDWHFSFTLPYHHHAVQGSNGFPPLLPTRTR